jgi:hypothetical protein
MNTTTPYNQAGPHRAGNTLEITELKRLRKEIEIRQGLIDGCGRADTILSEIRRVVLNTWAGRTASGDPVHIHYHVGVLTIEVDAPTPRGTRSPVVVMRWNPRRAMAEISSPVLPPDRKLEIRDLMLHREQLLIAATAAESREARCQFGDEGCLIHESQLLQWLRDHHRRFDELAARGLAGSKLRFRVIQEDASAALAA